MGDVIDVYGDACRFLDEFLEPFYEAWQADPEAAWAILEAFEREEISAEVAAAAFREIAKSDR